MNNGASWHEKLLERLGPAAGYPPTPDVRAAVLRRIEPEASGGERASGLLRPVLAAVAVLVIAAVLVFAVSRDARDAVADFLGLSVEGETIERLRDDPATPLPEPPQIEEFARRTPQDEAEAILGLELPFPEGAGEPKATWEARYQGNSAVILQYESYNLWVMNLRDDAYVKKLVAGETIVESVVIHDRAAYWISGGRRIVTYVDSNGTEQTGTTRTVDVNTLLWSRNGVYYRIETTLSLDEAMKIATSIPATP